MSPICRPIRLRTGPQADLAERRDLSCACRCCAKDEPIGVITLAPGRCQAIHQKQIELVTNLRRPGGDRDRERAAVRRGAGAHQGAVAVARRSAHRAGPPGADREARLARPAHRRHRPRDQEPAQFRQQFLGAFGGTDRRTERVLEAGRARRQDAGRDRRTDPDAERQPRKGGAARQARRLHRQEHAAAFARGIRRAPARRHQRDRRGEPQSRLSRRARREIRLQHHAAARSRSRRPA